MAWVKLDDGFPNNPKVAGVSLRARWLHVVALCYCGRNLTDGALTERAVRVVVAEADVPKRHVEELHHAGLWNRAGDGYVINDYLEYNPSADEVREQKRMRAEAGRKGGMKSGAVRRENATLTPEERQKRARAASRANTALKAGRIKIEPCSECGSSLNLEMHHPDYDKPEEVVWLCADCHRAHHREALAKAPAQANGSPGASKHELKPGGSTPSRPVVEVKTLGDQGMFQIPKRAAR